MTFRNFQRLGFDLTEEEVAAYSRKVDEAYRGAYRTINKRLQAAYLALSDVKPEDRFNALLKYNRLDKLLKQIQTDYLKYSTQAGKDTLTGLQIAMSNNYYRQQFAMSWAATDAAFTVLPNALVEVAVYGTESSIKAVTKAMEDKFNKAVNYMPQTGSLTKLLSENAQKEVNSITRAVVSGLRNGQSYRKTAQAVKRVIGEASPEGYTGAMASAKRILQTESTRILNAAAYANSQQLESQGIEIIREWDAVLDLRTRDRHQSLDGKVADKNGLFHIDGDSAKYPGDFSSAALNINCRCGVIEYTEGMRPDIRTGRNPVTGKSETFEYMNYPDWAKSNGLKQDKNGRWK